MKITVLSLDLYGFNKFIYNELLNKEVEAAYINSAAFKYKYKSFIDRLFNFLNKTFLKKNKKKILQTEYVLNLLNKTDSKQDFILVVDPAHFNHTILEACRKKAIKLIAYNYDSMAQLDLPKDKMSYFDEIYSFDKDDCENNQFKFITNFIYLDKLNLTKNFLYKAFTIQSKSKDRIKTLSKIADNFDRNNQKNYEFMIYGNPSKNVNKNIIFFNERLGIDIFLDKMKKSEILIDLVRDGQKGLSFRVFEAMALQKKLITTNKEIINYDFYNPNNIFVIDPNNLIISEDFLKTTYQPISTEIYNHYSLNNWIKTIFGI